MESDLPLEIAERKMPACDLHVRVQKIVSSYPLVQRLR